MYQDHYHQPWLRILLAQFYPGRTLLSEKLFTPCVAEADGSGRYFAYMIPRSEGKWNVLEAGPQLLRIASYETGETVIEAELNLRVVMGRNLVFSPDGNYIAGLVRTGQSSIGIFVFSLLDQRFRFISQQLPDDQFYYLLWSADSSAVVIAKLDSTTLNILPNGPRFTWNVLGEELLLVENIPVELIAPRGLAHSQNPFFPPDWPYGGCYDVSPDGHSSFYESYDGGLYFFRH